MRFKSNMGLGPEPSFAPTAQQHRRSSRQRGLWLCSLALVTLSLFAIATWMSLSKPEAAASVTLEDENVALDNTVARLSSGGDAVTLRMHEADLARIATLVRKQMDVTQPAGPQPIADCIDDVKDLAQVSTIYFASGETSLTAKSLRKLKTLGQSLDACPKVVLRVSGHSDSYGDQEHNLSLSWDRADNAVAALTAMGFDAHRIETLGLGARVPASQGDTDGSLDRRVEFSVTRYN